MSKTTTQLTDEIKELCKRILLNNVGTGNVTALVEKLHLMSPPAFRIGSRIKSYVRHIATNLDLPDVWEFEVAAILSQIGCIALPPEIMEKVDAGLPLALDEQKLFAEHPEIGALLIRDIPNIRNIALMIGTQQKPFSRSSAGNDFRAEDRVALGGHLLRVSLDFDQLLAQDLPVKSALMRLRRRVSDYAPEVLNALEDLEVHQGIYQRKKVVKAVRVSEMDTRMILDGDVYAKDGRLLAPKGTAVTYPILGELRTCAESIGVVEPVQVLILPHAAKAGR